MNVIGLLRDMRDFGGTPRTQGLADATVERFAGIDPSLVQAIEEAAAYHQALRADMGDFGKRVQSRELSTPSTAQLSRGLVRTGVGPWRHYHTQLTPMMPHLERWVRALGYAEVA